MLKNLLLFPDKLVILYLRWRGYEVVDPASMVQVINRLDDLRVFLHESKDMRWRKNSRQLRPGTIRALRRLAEIRVRFLGAIIDLDNAGDEA